MGLQERITRLEKLDTCAVSDAMDVRGMSGTVDGLLRRSTTQRIAGRVQTLKLGDTPPEGGSKQHLGTRSIVGAESTDVIVVEQSTGIQCACWGGVLANAAKHRGIRGVIAEGPVRDVDEYEELCFPVFSRSTTANTARGRVYEASYNESVRIGDIDVYPGDLVIADGSSVVFIPGDFAEDVIENAERIAKKERLMTEAIRSGRSVAEVMGADYETMLGTQK